MVFHCKSVNTSESLFAEIFAPEKISTIIYYQFIYILILCMLCMYECMKNSELCEIKYRAKSCLSLAYPS